MRNCCKSNPKSRAQIHVFVLYLTKDAFKGHSNCQSNNLQFLVMVQVLNIPKEGKDTVSITSVTSHRQQSDEESTKPVSCIFHQYLLSPCEFQRNVTTVLRFTKTPNIHILTPRPYYLSCAITIQLRLCDITVLYVSRCRDFIRKHKHLRHET